MCLCLLLSRTYDLHHSTLAGYTDLFDRHSKGNFDGTHGTWYINSCLSITGNSSQCHHILGDFTPRYLVDGYKWDEKWYHEGMNEPVILVPQKIKLLLPNVKLIMIFRDPSERLLSSYRYFRLPKGVTRSAEDFHYRAMGQVAAWQRCARQLPNIRRCMYGYAPEVDPPLGTFWHETSHDQVRYGFYYLYLREWLDVFPRDQFLFLRFEDYRDAPLETLEQQVLPFLGLDPYRPEARELIQRWQQEKTVFNIRSRYPKDMFPETKKVLDELYAPYNVKLMELLGDRKYLWGEHRAGGNMTRRGAQTRD